MSDQLSGSVITWYNISATLKTHFILQVISDVFGAPVFVSDIPNSAALGSCYRAKHGVYQRRLWVLYLQSICMSCNFHIHVHVSWFEGLDGCDFSDVVLNHPQPECVARPTEGANQVSRSSRSFWTDVHLIKKNVKQLVFMVEFFFLSVNLQWFNGLHLKKIYANKIIESLILVNWNQTVF